MYTSLVRLLMTWTFPELLLGDFKATSYVNSEIDMILIANFAHGFLCFIWFARNFFPVFLAAIDTWTIFIHIYASCVFFLLLLPAMTFFLSNYASNAFLGLFLKPLASSKKVVWLV